MEKYLKSMNDSDIKAITGDIQKVLGDMCKVFGICTPNTTLGSGNSSCGKVNVRLPSVYKYKVKVANLKKRLKKHRSNA